MLYKNSRFQARQQNCEKWLLWSVSSYPSICTHKTTLLQLDGFSWNLMFEYFFWKSVENIKVRLKSDKNNEYFTCRPIHIYDNISLNSSFNEKCCRQFCREIKTHVLCSISFFFFQKSFCLWDTGEKCCKAGQVTDDTKIRHMCIACWITWGTDTLRICNTYCFYTATLKGKVNQSRYRPGVVQRVPGS